MMGWRVTWRVTCESCEATGPEDRKSRVAELKAIQAGWRTGRFYGMARHLCPVCALEELPDYWWEEELFY